MLGGSLGRGRALPEKQPPAALRRPLTRARGGAGGGGGESAPAPLRRPLTRPSSGLPSSTATAASAAVPTVPATPQSCDPQPVTVSAAEPTPLNPLSAPFVPRSACPVAEPLVEPEPEPEPGQELHLQPEVVDINGAIWRDIPEPSDDYQNMIYNNITDTLFSLSCLPARCDRLGANLVDNLNGWLPSSGIRLSVVLDWLLNQVVCSSSFGYVCAELCHLLCTRCRVTEDGRTFRDLLLSRCQSLYKAADALLAESVRHFSELTVLFCELYLHVRLSDGEEPIAVLGSAVLDLCGKLMDDVTPERVATVCQVLKLTGATLESQRPADLSALMERVREAAFDGRLSRDSRYALLEMTTLRASRWGAEEAVTSHADPGVAPQTDLFLSSEERWFLEQHEAALADDGDEDSGQDVDDAYETFLDELEPLPNQTY